MMGYVIPDLGIGWEPNGGAWWAVVSVSRGSPAHHSGFAVGPVNAPRSGTPAAVLEALLSSAADGEAALIDALGDVPVSEGGPFPGVVPADWYDGLPTAVSDLVLDGMQAWAATGVAP
jgi:hypothetical protein